MTTAEGSDLLQEVLLPGRADRGGCCSPRAVDEATQEWMDRKAPSDWKNEGEWDPDSNPRTGYSPGGYTLRFLTDGVGSSWAKAVAINGQSPCGAAVTAAAKLLLWHWLQPAL